MLPKRVRVKYLLGSVKTTPQPVPAPLVRVGWEATSKAHGHPQPSRNTGQGKTGGVKAQEPLLRLRHGEGRYEGQSGIGGHRETSTPRDWSTTPRPRSREGPHPNRSSRERTRITPLKADTLRDSKPPVRTAEALSGWRRGQEAQASRRKASGIQNWLDRIIANPKGG